MTNRRRHAPHLPVLAFDQFERDPTIRHALAKADRRHTRRNLWRRRLVAGGCHCRLADLWKMRRGRRSYFWLRLQQSHTAGQGLATLDHQTLLQLLQRFTSRNPFHLRPIFAFMGMAWMQENVHSTQVHRFRNSLSPRNPHQAVRWDKHSWENPNSARVRFGEPSVVNCESTPKGLLKAMSTPSSAKSATETQEDAEKMFCFVLAS